MNGAGVLYCLAVAIAAASPSDVQVDGSVGTLPITERQSKEPDNRRPIEILIAGPEDARSRMGATIRPLLGSDPDLRWICQASLPAEGQGGTAQIWIDVSSPMQVRVYLPALEPKGTTTVRTLPRAAAGGDGDDLLACEAAAHIVKAAVLVLRHGPDQPAKEGYADAARTQTHPGSSSGSPYLHDGFYLRLTAGPGYLTASEPYEFRTDEYAGLGLSLNAAVGSSLVGKLVVYGEFTLTTVTRAVWTRDGDPAPSPNKARDLVLWGWGPGLAYYLPFNTYVSGALTLAKLWFTDDESENPPTDTNWGLGGTFMLGKEWWLSPQWGLGVSGKLSYTSLKHVFREPRDDYYASFDPHMRVIMISLLFSATYN